MSGVRVTKEKSCRLALTAIGLVWERIKQVNEVIQRKRPAQPIKKLTSQ